MSTFELAVDKILQHEGHFVNHPADPGGATKYGISQRFLSHLLNRQITIEEIKNLTKKDAIQLYKAHWWDRYHYNAIIDQSIATKILDLAINIGPFYAHRLLQHACWSINGELIAGLKDDGIIGSLTINAVNSFNPALLLASLQNEAAKYYHSLNQPSFEKGWLTRVYN